MQTQQGEKLNFLFVSKWGDLLDIVKTVQEEGHTVKMYIDYKPCREVGDGFVPKARQWEKHIPWADVIVFDYTGYGKMAEKLRASGKLVIGGTEYTDNLELDRSFGQAELKRHKIKILKYKEFTTFHDAIAYVEANPNLLDIFEVTSRIIGTGSFCLLQIPIIAGFSIGKKSLSRLFGMSSHGVI